jgi:hypothetical protein
MRHIWTPRKKKEFQEGQVLDDLHRLEKENEELRERLKKLELEQPPLQLPHVQVLPAPEDYRESYDIRWGTTTGGIASGSDYYYVSSVSYTDAGGAVPA